MNLHSVMQASATKAFELFTSLAATSDTALKTRERLYAELKAELDKHLELEQKHLLPALRKEVDAKDLVATAIRDVKDLRAMVSELDTLPKNDEAFLRPCCTDTTSGARIRPNVGGCLDLTPDIHLAVQAEPGPPSPHSE